MAKQRLMSIIFSLLIAGAHSVLAGDYLPLDFGNEWNSSNAYGEVETSEIVGMMEIFGHDVFLREYTESPHYLGHKVYFSSDDNSASYINGWFNGSYGILYDPPVLMVDSQLSLGKTWSTETDLYSLPDTTYHTSWRLDYEVVHEADLQVGAGTFPRRQDV